VPIAPGAAALHEEQQDQDADRDRDDGTSSSEVLTSSRPSTALSTEMAGVIAPSPYSSAVPNTPSATSRPALVTCGSRLRHHERGEREDPALTLVVGLHHEQQVLDRDDHEQ
jgi:hypothetical protein